MSATITVFETSPDRGRGLARDMPVRWALEEAGRPYEVRLVGFDGLKQPAHLARQPFGQIPTYEEDGLVLFESGAIVHHIGQECAALLPEDRAARSRAVTWMFAALNTVEPPVFERDMVRMLESEKPWYAERMQRLDETICRRLEAVSGQLGTADWLEGAFSAGDLMMISVLRRLAGSELLSAFPALEIYVARGEARPAFQRAFAAQRDVFLASQGR